MTRHVFFKNSFAFSKSSVTASPSAIGNPYPQIVQDMFLSPFLFFLYIQYAGFRRQQNATGKQICWALRPANTKRQACSLDCIAKLRFAFQPAPADKAVTPGISRQPATALRHISFCTSLHNLTLARNLHSGLTGQHTSTLIFSFFFFHSSLYKKGNRQSRFPSLFLAIPNLVQI